MILARRYSQVSCFGGSGSAIAQLAEREIVTSPNHWRADALAGHIAAGTAMIRRTLRHRSGAVEVLTFPNPQFLAVLRHRYAYPGDVRATLIALADQLRSHAGLRERAEQIGITCESIAEMIESVAGTDTPAGDMAGNMAGEG